MNRAVGAVGVLAALVLATAAACTGDDQTGIRTGAVERATVAEIIEAPASVTARTVATVTAPASGRVAQLFVSDGQQVPAGALLAVIDSPQVSRQLEQAERAMATAGAAVVETGPGLDLVANQRRTDTAAAQAFTAARNAAGSVVDPNLRTATFTQITAAETQYRAAAAQARQLANAVSRGFGQLGDAVNALSTAQRIQAETAYELAKAQADALTLRAPVGGTVQLGGASSPAPADLSGLLGQLPADLQTQAGQLGTTGQGQPPSTQADGSMAVGSLVGPGSAVATVVDVSALGLVAEVDETDVLLVKPGVRAVADLDAVPGATYPATVTAVGLLPTTSARGGVSYRVRLSLGAGALDGEPAPQPRPGMSAVAKLQVRTAEDATAVPAAAIVRDGDKDAVWLVDHGEARRRQVTIGAQGEDLVEITAGVDVGQRIVVGGADRVEDGQELQ